MDHILHSHRRIIELRLKQSKQFDLGFTDSVDSDSGRNFLNHLPDLAHHFEPHLFLDELHRLVMVFELHVIFEDCRVELITDVFFFRCEYVTFVH